LASRETTPREEHSTTPTEESQESGAEERTRKEAVSLSDDERLMDKVAEFEGKIEALASLKASLYTAIA